MALCEDDDVLEIKNILVSSYSVIMKKPTNNSIRSLNSDGKDILVAESRAVYALVPDNTTYWTRDNMMLNSVRKNPSDKFLFVRYLNYALGNPEGPYAAYISELAEKFVEIFSNPEDAVFEVVKKYISKNLQKIFKVVLSYYQHFEMSSLRQLVYGIIQTSYFSKIYWLLFAMVTCRYKNQDVQYLAEIRNCENYKPGDVGIPKQFWLMEESLADPPPKRGKKKKIMIKKKKKKKMSQIKI